MRRSRGAILAKVRYRMLFWSTGPLMISGARASSKRERRPRWPHH